METRKKFKKELNLNRISLKKISLFFLILLPFAIIIGQAPSDIIVSSISILFLVNSLIQKDWSWIKTKWIRRIFFLWIYLILWLVVIGLGGIQASNIPRSRGCGIVFQAEMVLTGERTETLPYQCAYV